MIKLIRANLAKSYKIIIVGLVLYALYSILIPIVFYENLIDDPNATEVTLMVNYGITLIPLQGILLALICPLIHGFDFQNHTIKNRLIVGHTKSKVYIANLLTTSVVALAMSAVYLLFFLIIDLPLFGKTSAPAKEIVLLLIDGTLMLLAYSSIFTFVTMTCKNTVATLIVSVVMIIFGVVIAFCCNEMVIQEPYWTYRYTNEVGEIVEEIRYNNRMPSNATKAFCQFLLDLLPSGQSFQLANENTVRWQMALCSLGMIGATTGAGMAVFNKTNIK